jgi:hypothetical protein
MREWELVFAAAVQPMEVVPVPLTGETVSQSALLSAVHVVAGTLTVRLVVEEPPAAPTVDVGGENPNVTPGAGSGSKIVTAYEKLCGLPPMITLLIVTFDVTSAPGETGTP